MSLRVLLADESTTIKKVMQLALQDFAVDVKAVHVGVDVAQVARAYKPDIVFADILLQKKNGYEVCAELKADPQLRSIPIVLMWSSFMELDENLAIQARANGRLEKPFDVEHLRRLILELVPRTHSQRLAHFLEFPASMMEELKQEEAAKQVAAPHSAEKAPTRSGWSMDSFEDINEFKLEAPPNAKPDSPPAPAKSPARPQAPLAQRIAEKIAENTASATKVQVGETVEDTEPWSHQDLSQFKLDLPPVSVDSEEFGMTFDMNDPDLVAEKTKPQRTQTASAGSIEDLEALNQMESLELETQVREEAEDTSLGTTLDHSAAAPFATSVTKSVTTSVGGTDFGATATGISFESSESKRLIESLSPQLEEVILMQSRNIIEEIVRRLVPELATTIIKQELQRLLAEATDSSAQQKQRQGETHR